MSDTPRMGLPLIEAAQAQKHVTHNEALVILDALAHLFLNDRDLADPPGAPAEGEAWLVAAPASGDWTGQEGRIAFFIDGGWRFYEPFRGLGAYVGDEQAIITYDGAEWSDFAALIAPQNLPLLGVGTTADGANPFAARLNNALFTALEVASGGDGDIRLKVNKEGAADTASFLFQSNWSGRAEIGLCGDEDFHFKVSPDGSQWADALTIDAATGALASQGNTLWHGGNDGEGSGLDADLLDGNEATDLANPPAASQAEAEAGTESALRSFSPQRLSQAIAALAGGGNALEGVERDIRLLALKQAADDGDRINMADGIADPLDDASDIDTGASTNIDTGTVGIIKPTVPSSQDQCTGGTASAEQNSADAADAFADDGGGSDWVASSAGTPRWIRYQFAGAVKVTRVRTMWNYTGDKAYTLQYSDNGTDWSDAGSTGTFSYTAGNWRQDDFTDAGAHLYWRINITTYAGSVVTTLAECEMLDTTVAPADMDCRSLAFSADAAPDGGRLHVQIGGADAGTLALNTDLIGYLSRDGGTSWAAAVLAEAGELADGTKIFEDNDIDLSGQPSGTAMKWRVATANGIDIALHGVVGQWM